MKTTTKVAHWISTGASKKTSAKSRYARSVPLTPRARRTLDAICPEQGLIFRRFEYRRVLVQAARKVLATEHEARHLSAHDFRHAALMHMAAVGSDLTAIGHIAGHKNATTTALYVHNSEAAARRAVARRAGILDTKVDTEAGQAAEKRPLVRPKFSESLGGVSWTRTRSQWIKNPSKTSDDVRTREKTRDEQCRIATDETVEAVSEPQKAVSRTTLIASLYAHASALARAGDIEAARVAHEAAGRLLAVPEVTNAVVDLNQRRKQ